MAKILTDSKKFFWLRSGRGIKSVMELFEAVGEMPDDEFFEHVNEQKNDFANWMKHVFEDKPLADKIRPLRTKEQFQEVLYNEMLKEEQGTKDKIRDIKGDTQKQIFKEDEGRFEKYCDEESRKNEQVFDKFDKRVQNLTDLKVYETPDEFEQLYGILMERISMLKQNISDARKEGRDAFLLDLKIRPLPSKLKFAKNAEDKDLFNKVEKTLDDCEQELQQIFMTEPINVKKEVELLASVDLTS